MAKLYQALLYQVLMFQVGFTVSQGDPHYRDRPAISIFVSPLLKYQFLYSTCPMHQR